MSEPTLTPIPVPEPEPTPEPVITGEAVTAFLNTDEGKSLIKPILDSHTTKGIETFKTKTMPKILEEEIAKRNPSETPEQKRIRELEEKIASQELNAQRAELKSATLKELTSNDLPIELSSMLTFDSEESMRDSIGNFQKVFKSFVDNAVEDRLKSSGANPSDKVFDGTDTKGMTRDKLLNMSTKESTAFFNENPELFRKLMTNK